jgi:hypothetical protein
MPPQPRLSTAADGTVAACQSNPSGTTRALPSYDVGVKPRSSPRRTATSEPTPDSAPESNSFEAVGTKFGLPGPALVDVSRDELVTRPILEIIHLPNGRGLG